MHEFGAWQERFGRLTAHSPEPWSPAIDVYETPGAYVVTAELPGLTREEIDLALEDSRLTIRAHRKDRAGSSGDIVRFHQVERGHGGFARTFEFAHKVDVEKVSADLSDGVLAITLPKIAPPAARRIEVR